MFPMEMETTVPCAPMGTAAIRMATKIASSMKNRSLNAKLKGAEVNDSITEPSSVTYVSVCAIRRGSSGSTAGGGRFRPTPSTTGSSSVYMASPVIVL
mmetsp:Transcript_8979/g.12877  ORF Transcript_8979/g.12877 Transcript_8979/m.12877 type:complete len:98 (-) Transcript_8979:20-313(-)